MAAEILDPTNVSVFRVFAYGVVPLLIPLFIYRWYIDPLRSIPGPFIAKFTKLWIISVDLRGIRAGTIHAAHQKYGPVVRVAPNEICFASQDAMNEIYHPNSKYTKTTMYQSIAYPGAFNALPHQQYRVMKKRLAVSFSPAAVAAVEPILHEQIAKFVKCVDKRLDQPIDILSWIRMLSLGVVGEAFVGDTFNGLDDEKTPELLHEIDSLIPTLWFWWMFPVLSTVLQYAPIPGVQRFLKASSTFRRYCTTRYNKYLANNNPREGNNMVARFVNERNELIEKMQPIPHQLSDDGIIDEMSNMIFAGTDTASNTLAYLFYELALNPDWQRRIREELKAIAPGRYSPVYDELARLPLLDAMMLETFRVHPAAPSALPRYVPEGGSTIGGVAVPEGVIVSCQAFTAHRDPKIFPSPENFAPQRWLDAEKAGTAELMRSQLLLFGKGPRTCLGRNIALMEIKCLTAAVVRRYEMSIDGPGVHEDMEMTDHFLMIPKGKQCVLKLRKV